MSVRTIVCILCCALLTVSCQVTETTSADGQRAREVFPVPSIDYEPSEYVCYKAGETITIDGKLDEADWRNASWTEPFVDIEDDAQPSPRFLTRAKMLWDSVNLYIAADMEEPHLWATLTERDAVIYHDNDFEFFIDPDGDSHEYYELEINAMGTEWDLLLIRPYRDGAPAVNAWDITGLQTAVNLRGSLNDPSDIDDGWSVEISVPWKVLAECAHRPSPPLSGDTWWVNYSRVQWQLDVVNGGYIKKTDSTGRNLPENNWVWSPQGLIAMHYPEMWGQVQFVDLIVGGDRVEFEPSSHRQARRALWQLYYAQRQYEFDHNRFTPDLSDLGLGSLTTDPYLWPPTLSATERSFTAYLNHRDGMGILHIDTEGRLRKMATPQRGN